MVFPEFVFLFVFVFALFWEVREHVFCKEYGKTEEGQRLKKREEKEEKFKVKSLVVQRVYEGIDLCVGLVWVIGMGKKVYRSLDGSRFLLGGDPKKKKRRKLFKNERISKN